MLARNSSLKRITGNIAIIFITLVILLRPAGPAQAASFTAGTATELYNAIYDAEHNNEADTITLTADFTLTAELPTITTPITIEGAGHTLNGGGSFRIFRSSGERLLWDLPFSLVQG